MSDKISKLKSYFDAGDVPTQANFYELIDAFIPKGEERLIKEIKTDANENVIIHFLQGDPFTIPKYELPKGMPISFITGLQVALDEKVSKSNNETIAGNKKFSEALELLKGLKLSNFTGTGLRNLVIKADGTVDVQAIATDVFINNVTYSDSTKKMTLHLVNGSTIDVDLSSLEEDLTGLQGSINTLTTNKLDKGGYTGTANDLNTNKRDKTAIAKSIVDNAGKLELSGDTASPGNNYYYGTNNAGQKGFHVLPAAFFNVTGMHLGGSQSNIANQEFTINLTPYKLKVGDKLVLNNFGYRGDFYDYTEFIEVGVNTNTSTKFKLGEHYGDFSSTWQTDYGTGDGTEATVVDLGSNQVGIKIYVSPSTDINFAPSGMTNWWELRADIQLKIN